MTLKTRLSVLLISTPFLAFVVVGGLMGNASARAGEDKFQHLKVFGNRGLRHFKRRGKLTDRRFALHQARKNRAARGIG